MKDEIDYKGAYENVMIGFEMQMQEIERLNNIIKPQKINYDYLKLLFEKKSKKEVVKAYTYKCEQLESLYNSYNKKEIELLKKDNIIKEVIRILNSARKHYDSEETNWAIERALRVLKNE